MRRQTHDDSSNPSTGAGDHRQSHPHTSSSSSAGKTSAQPGPIPSRQSHDFGPFSAFSDSHVDTRSTHAHAHLHLQDHHAVPLQSLQPLRPHSRSPSRTSGTSGLGTQARAQTQAAGDPVTASAGHRAGSDSPSATVSVSEPICDPAAATSPSHHVHHSSDPVDEAVVPADLVEPVQNLVQDDHDTNNMASHQRSPFLNSSSAGNRLEGPYGTVSLTPSRNTSPASDDDGEDNDTHQLRRVSGTTRSNASRRSLVSRSSTRLSEELDGAMLVSGLEGRFGMAEAPIAGGIIEEDMKTDTSEDVPLMGRDDDEESQASDHEGIENSPHDAVRASVPPTDDTTLSINTPRMWCLSVLFSFLGSSTNLFFSLRYPSVAITPVIALLLVHPLGHLWDFVLKRSYDPGEEFIDGERTPSLLERDDPLRRMSKAGSWRLWLAQGRWNEKEHTCVYVSSNVAFGFAFATDVIVEQTKFYHQEAPIMYQILLIISTQILGYGFAGLTRRFLVQPSGMIWPGTLMSAAMFGTLHKQENKIANGWRMSRWNFFYVVFLGSSLFYFLPGLLMPALSYFNVITWFSPKNVVLSNLFGVSSGLGMFPLTFDWAQVTYIGSPLLVPFWASVNVIAGLVVVMWLIAPVCYYANVLYTSYMPIISTAVFDNTGNLYNVSRILTPDFVFDRPAYAEYSRVFLPVTYMLSYGVQFAGLAALLTHTACWHGQDIWRTWKKALAEARDREKPGYTPVADSPGAEPETFESEENVRLSQSTSNVDDLLSREDIHSRLMKRYKDVPMTWYLITFVSMAAIGMFIVEYYPIHLPWYGLLLALALGGIFFIPNGIIMAVTNQHSSIYLICQLICGAIFPGRPIANMVFVTYGYISSAQGIKFASDLKLGHYMKIPPRIMFTVQVVATLVSSLTQIVVLNWMFANVRGLCTSEAVNGFTCPIARVHFNGSILWGVVGVNEFFGPKAIYRALVWCFPLGAILPIPLWLYSRHRKHSFIRKVNLPVIFGAMSWIPPATGLNFSVWAVVCYLFNYHIKRRANAWWSKYTMTLSAALDSGLAFGIIIVFFGFVYPGWMTGFSWWGTEVYKQGCDWQACPYRTLSEGERFGPDAW